MGTKWWVGVLVLLLGAQRIPALSIKEARQQIEDSGMRFTVEDFLERVRQDDIDSVQLFLDAGMKINSKDDEEATALMIAAEMGHLEIANLLMTQGADVNAKDHYGATAVLKAVTSHNECFIEPPPAMEEDPRCDSDEESFVQVITSLLESGADPNAKDNGGATALHWAKGDNLMLDLLLSKGVDPNLKNNAGETALADEAYFGNPDSVRLLLEKGADPEITDHDGRPIIVGTAARGRSEILAIMLEKKSKIIEQDRATLMFIAHVTAAHAEEVQSLLQKGANPNLKAATGETALMLAVEHPFPLDQQKRKMIQLLMDNGADANAKDLKGRTALMRAAIWLSPEATGILLQHGADPNSGDNDGTTALMIAVKYGRSTLVDLLLKQKANPNAKDHNGKTSLMVAADSTSYAEIVKMLLENGADPNAADNQGNTALTFATKQNAQDIIELLKSAAAKIPR